MTFNFDKNQGRTLYNFTKQENTEAKSCCDFRIESNNGKRYPLSIKGKDALREIAKRLFCIMKRQCSPPGATLPLSDFIVIDSAAMHKGKIVQK